MDMSIAAKAIACRNTLTVLLPRLGEAGIDVAIARISPARNALTPRVVRFSCYAED
jgi:hypothetical protein